MNNLNVSHRSSRLPYLSPKTVQNLPKTEDYHRLLWQQYATNLRKTEVNGDYTERLTLAYGPRSVLLAPATLESIEQAPDHPTIKELAESGNLTPRQRYGLDEPLSPKEAMAYWGWAPADLPNTTLFVRNQLLETPHNIDALTAPILKPPASSIHVRGKLMKEVFAYLKQGHVPKGQYIHNFPKFLQSIAWTCQEPKKGKAVHLRTKSLINLCDATRVPPCRFILFSAEYEEFGRGLMTWGVATEIARHYCPGIADLDMNSFLDMYSEDHQNPCTLRHFTENALRKLAQALTYSKTRQLMAALAVED